MTATAPVKRAKRSAAYRARFALLDGMKDRMLREYARDYIPEEIDDFVLSDAGEREAMIHRLCEVMVEDKGEDEGTEQGEE